MNIVNSIIVLDCPGFQNPASCGQHQDGASFNDLCHNYFFERLQLLFHYMNLDVPRERYNQVILIAFGDVLADSNAKKSFSRVRINACLVLLRFVHFNIKILYFFIHPSNGLTNGRHVDNNFSIQWPIKIMFLIFRNISK